MQQELDKQVGQQRANDSTAKGWLLTWAMDGSGIEQNLNLFLLLTKQQSKIAQGFLSSPVRRFSVSAPGYVLYVCCVGFSSCT